MKREDVFIANILKCRPPGNRDPQPDEIEACWPYLERQIELIEPRVIATLGNFATKKITGSQTGITRVRGTPQVHELGGRTVFVFPLLHPGGGAADPVAASRRLREDFAKLPALLAEPLPELGAGRRRPTSAERSGAAAPATRTASSTCSLDRRAHRGTRGDRGASGARLAARLEPGDVVLVSGELGSGKTTLVRGACRGARRHRAGRLADLHDRPALPRRARPGLPPRPLPARRTSAAEEPGAARRLPDRPTRSPSSSGPSAPGRSSSSSPTESGSRRRSRSATRGGDRREVEVVERRA